MVGALRCDRCEVNEYAKQGASGLGNEFDRRRAQSAVQAEVGIREHLFHIADLPSSDADEEKQGSLQGWSRRQQDVAKRRSSISKIASAVPRCTEFTSARGALLDTSWRR